MWSPPEPGRYRSGRRPVLDLGMTPLIDIVFLLLIFFMLTSRFVVHEGIQVNLPATELPHALPATEAHRITVRSDGTLFFEGRAMAMEEMDRYLAQQNQTFIQSSFEIQADRGVSVQVVVLLLEMLRDKGAAKVTLGTDSSRRQPFP